MIKLSASLRTRLMLMFLLVSIVPILGITSVTNRLSTEALRTEAMSKLDAIKDSRKSALVEHLKRDVQNVSMLTRMTTVQESVVLLKEFHDAQNTKAAGSYPVESEGYSAIRDRIDLLFNPFLRIYQYPDVYLICAKHGHVMYSVTQGEDLGTNLGSGKAKESGLAQVWKKAVDKETVQFVDFSHYGSDNSVAMFMAAPVLNTAGKVDAVIAVKFTPEYVDRIMALDKSLGQTAEVYMIGSDQILRSNLTRSPSSEPLKTLIDTTSAKAAANEESGDGLTENYAGISVLSSFTHLGLDDDFGTEFDWGVIAEIEESEALDQANSITLILLYITLGTAGLVALLGFLASRGISNPIMGGVNVLASTSSQVSAASSQLATSSSQTATAVAETSVTVEEVKQTAMVSSMKAQEVAETSRETLKISQMGEHSVGQTVLKMEGIRKQMEIIADAVVNLSEQSQAIGEIIQAVDDLAEQSNLLAVNASIEAAKAGEQGRGFAVVAQEVKSLAEQSKEATGQVRAILSDIQKATSAAVMATEQGTKAVDAGTSQSHETGTAIRQLSDSIQHAAQSAGQIAASSQEQLAGMEQINEAMDNIRSAAQQNVDSSRQLETAVKTLEGLGRDLRYLIQRVKS